MKDCFVEKHFMMDKLNTPASWQEAFELHKIPVIRNIEEQLRTGVSRDKERLRDIVGYVHTLPGDCFAIT